jgi:excinuclease ABC subunit C
MINIYDVPKSAGCYLFKDSKDKIIYIGKAKNLQKRVKSYFQNKIHDTKTQQLIKNITDYEFIATDTEVEALILENNLINKHKPKYNIDLKESNRYSYLKLTNTKYPQLIVYRGKDCKSNCFGPFVYAGQRNDLQKLLIRLFKIRTCKRLPKKECLRYHINLCSAPCTNKISEEDYNNQIAKVKEVLKGNINNLLNNLKLKMKSYSKEKSFEKALILRDEITALDYLKEKQKAQRQIKYDEDILSFIQKNNKIYLIIFNVYKGMLLNKKEFNFDENPNFFEEFILLFYSKNPIPKEIILPKDISQSLKKYLEDKKKEKIIFSVPKIGEKKHLLNLVEKNIQLSFFSSETKLQELKDILNLETLPTTIECFDISHISGSSMVGSMIQFKNGLPNNANYRRYKIQTTTQVDDFKALYEVVTRRYIKLKSEKLPFPDLIVIDGGKGQLSSALKALNDINVKIPIISIAKRLEEIFIPNQEKSILLNKNNKGLQLIQSLRDEAHRFAINYNRLLRKKELFKK